MRIDDEVVFSNNLCCAFMTDVVRSFANFHPNYFLGRTAMQKLVYFSKVLCVPVPCSYDIYTYGPYSDKVASSVDSLLADDVIVDTSNHPSRFSNYRLGPNSGELLARFQNEIDPYQSTIDAVVKNLGRFDPQDLELVSTLHFVGQKLKAIRRGAPTKEEVIAEFRRIKKDKFPFEKIDQFYEALSRTGLMRFEAVS